MVAPLTKAVITMMARGAGSAFRINDAKDYRNLYWATVARESFNIASCGASVLGTNILLKEFLKRVAPGELNKAWRKAFRGSLFMEVATTIVPAVLSEYFSRRMTGYDMSKLLQKELNSNSPKTRHVNKDTGVNFENNLPQQAIARFGEMPRFQARFAERLANVGAKPNPFSHSKTATVQVAFNANQHF